MIIFVKSILQGVNGSWLLAAVRVPGVTFKTSEIDSELGWVDREPEHLWVTSLEVSGNELFFFFLSPESGAPQRCFN